MDFVINDEVVDYKKDEILLPYNVFVNADAFKGNSFFNFGYQDSLLMSIISRLNGVQVDCSLDSKHY